MDLQADEAEEKPASAAVAAETEATLEETRMQLMRSQAEVVRLAQIRDDVENEVRELTASLFQVIPPAPSPPQTPPDPTWILSSSDSSDSSSDSSDSSTDSSLDSFSDSSSPRNHAHTHRSGGGRGEG